MRKSILPVTLATALAICGVAGSASAADTVAIPTTLSVDNMCNIEASDPAINGTITWDGVGTTVNHGYGSVSVLCNAGTAYTIDASPTNGALDLVGDSTAGHVPAYLWQGTNPGTVWGRAADSQGVSGVATGEWDSHNFYISFNTESDGYTPLPVPAMDDYRATPMFTVLY